ncbi:hypothetical protein COU37_00325 [Candidatus Micrarchaeota archaeon CG10_big_fil_rev_8_21_14_0_10_45_29]|nr:MAG: hypothetical protein COU37_00325 [Candidatus Micrarchaeota archaeon CG10_big_fil_rev_8_21_14_0_10_45_29]
MKYSQAYEGLSKEWKNTCRILLKEEIGELSDFSGYLQKYIEPVRAQKSSLSQKSITLSNDAACPPKRVIGMEELGVYAKKTEKIKLDINQIKDIDSIISSLEEKFYYCGNVVLGNSSNVENSHRCTNTNYALASHEVADCQYISNSTMARYCEYIFGSSIMGETKYLINVLYSTKSVRCMECTHPLRSSDCYFGANLEDCSDCMFSFNLKNKNNSIGNLPLEKSKYMQIKQKLLSEIARKLKKEKNMRGIIELIAGIPSPSTPKERPEYVFKTQHPPSKEVEEAFQATTKVLLGKPLSNLQTYEKYLLANTKKPISAKSAISSKPLHAIPMLFNRELKNSFVSRDEAAELSSRRISPQSADELSLENMDKILHEIKYTCPQVILGENEDVEESVVYNTSRHCYGGSVYYFAKYCAYCFWPRNSEYIFGSTSVFSSKFCLACHYSSSLTRCFELSDCNNCSDCYFCHNVENCTECMFCFNTKAKRYAIGNVEYPKEVYLKLKKKIQEEIFAKLEKDKKLDLNIFNLGCKKNG